MKFYAGSKVEMQLQYLLIVLAYIQAGVVKNTRLNYAISGGILQVACSHSFVWEAELLLLKQCHDPNKIFRDEREKSMIFIENLLEIYYRYKAIVLNPVVIIVVLIGTLYEL